MLAVAAAVVGGHVQREVLDDDNHGLRAERMPWDLHANARRVARAHAQRQRERVAQRVRPDAHLLEHHLTLPAGDNELVAGHVHELSEALLDDLVHVRLEAAGGDLEERRCGDIERGHSGGG